MSTSRTASRSRPFRFLFWALVAVGIVGTAVGCREAQRLGNCVNPDDQSIVASCVEQNQCANLCPACTWEQAACAAASELAAPDASVPER